MDSSNIIAMAKQGDPKSIAQVISHAFDIEDINCKARNNNGCLEIFLRSANLISEKQVLSHIYTEISRLQLDCISQVLVVLYCGGEISPRWRHSFWINKDGSIKDGSIEDGSIKDGSVEALTYSNGNNDHSHKNSLPTNTIKKGNNAHSTTNFLLSRNGERFILVFATFVITNLLWLALSGTKQEIKSDVSTEQEIITSETSSSNSAAATQSTRSSVVQPVQSTPLITLSEQPQTSTISESTPEPTTEQGIITSETSSSNSAAVPQSTRSSVVQPVQSTPLITLSEQPQTSTISESTPEPAIDTSAESFLTMFLDEITTTSSDGTSSWCKSKEILISTLFSPRAYTILNFNETNNSFYASVRIESSNRGGSPIISTWSFYGNKEPAMVYAASNHGWCVAHIRKSN